MSKFVHAEGLIHESVDVQVTTLQKLQQMHQNFEAFKHDSGSHLLRICKRSLLNTAVIKGIMTELKKNKFKEIPLHVKEQVKFMFGGFGGTVVIENANRINRLEETKNQLSLRVRKCRRLASLIKSPLIKQHGFEDPFCPEGREPTHAGCQDPPAELFTPGHLKQGTEMLGCITKTQTWHSFTAQSVLNQAADTAMLDVAARVQASNWCGKSWKSAFLLQGHMYKPVSQQGWTCVSPKMCDKPRNVCFWILGHLEGTALAWPLEQSDDQQCLKLFNSGTSSSR